MKTFKFKLYRSKKNKSLDDTINLSGRAWNYSIARSKRYYRLFGKSLNHMKLQTHMTFRKELFHENMEKIYKKVDTCEIGFEEFDARANKLYWSYGFLEDIPSQSLQQLTERMRNSYKLFFDKLKKKQRTSPPSFQPSRKYPSFTLKQAGWKYEETGLTEDNKIKINGQNYKFHKSRRIEGKVKTITIKRDTRGQMYICFACEVDQKVMTGIKSTAPQKARAIDFGLKDFLVFDDGSRISSPEFLRRSIQELRRVSRAYSRKQKGSGNREQSRRQLAKLQEKFANQRLDWARKTAHAICKSLEGARGFIFIEDLNLQGMKKLWGRKVSDLAYGLFVSELTRVSKSYDIEVIKIGRFERSTGVCSETGLIIDLTLADRNWNCDCGHMHDRDTESAKTILKAGLGLARDNAVSPERKLRQAM